MRKKGPLFTALFHPLGIVIATALGVIVISIPYSKYKHGLRTNCQEIYIFVTSRIVILMICGNLECFCFLCVCSLIGSVIIVSGFYEVMWGKAKERKVQEIDDDNGEEESLESGKIPMLINKAEGIDIYKFMI